MATSRFPNAVDEIEDKSNCQLFIIRCTSLEPDISVTYFKPDEKKDGGTYVSVKGRVKKVDVHMRQILLTNGTALPMDYIISMEGAVLEAMDEAYL